MFCICVWLPFRKINDSDWSWHKILNQKVYGCMSGVSDGVHARANVYRASTWYVYVGRIENDGIRYCRERLLRQP
jgi:hypothetical protein